MHSLPCVVVVVVVVVVQTSKVFVVVPLNDVVALWRVFVVVVVIGTVV